MGKFGGLRANWMGAVVDQSTKLTGLTIPGTHDSGTCGLDRASVSRCQEKTISEQLDHGIRFLDIRLVPEERNSVQDCQLYHGTTPLGIWFSDVLAVCKTFLSSTRRRRSSCPSRMNVGWMPAISEWR